MGKNPASIDIVTGVITINVCVWKNLCPVQRQLLILHEMAHVELQTLDDEKACDRWALEKFAGSRPNSLRKALDAFERLLDLPFMCEKRKDHIYLSLLEIDAERFSNPIARTKLEQWKNGSGKIANLCPITITAAAAALITLGTQTIIGRRNDWSRGNNNSTTAVRDAILKGAAQAVIGQHVEQHGSQGVNAMQIFVRNRPRMQTLVFNTIVGIGTFNDNNIFTRDWGRRGESDFFRSHPWARARIDHFADQVWADFKKTMIASGFRDDTPEGKSEKLNISMLLKNPLVLGGLGVLVLGLIIKNR